MEGVRVKQRSSGDDSYIELGPGQKSELCGLVSSGQ